MKCWYKNVCELECQQEHCIRFMEMKNLVQTSGLALEKSYPILLDAGVDYNAYVQLDNIKHNISSFVEQGKNLYIFSDNTGNGKTSWSIKLLMKYFDNVWAGNGFRTRGLFFHTPSLMLRLKDFNKTDVEELRKEIINVDMVVFDDIAGTKFSDYDEMVLLTIIDARLMAKKCNIYTSNYTSKNELESILGVRLASRIINTSLGVQFKGKDRRWYDTTTINQ